MNLERVVNELLLDLFEYLPSVDLLRAFSHLNHRFNRLLIVHFRSHDLDFRTISKQDFDLICQENRSLIIEHITRLCLSDDDDTPNQMNHFFSYSFFLPRFAQLKSLTLFHLSSYEAIQQVVEQFDHRSRLTDLRLIDCHMAFHRKTLSRLLNRIWRLPKLTRCRLDLRFRSPHDFCFPTVRSKSIERLRLDNALLDSNQLIRLFRCSPNLRYLYAHIAELPNETQFSSATPLISSIQVVVDHITDGTLNLFRKLTHLTHFTLQSGQPYMNGHQWRDFILEHWPKLRVFRFLNFFSVKTEDELHELINSYRTPFWLVDRQWFVRCHWNVDKDAIWVYFHTLPYAFSLYSYVLDNFNLHVESTCPADDRYCSYNRVTRLLDPQPSSTHLCIRFPNVRHLQITLPVVDQFWSTFPRFEQLTSVDVASASDADAELALSQLQRLIDRAPRLHLLTIGHWNSSAIQRLPLSLTSNSIRRLDLQSYHYLRRDRRFDREQCTTFLRSPLAQQCEVLQIVVDHRSNIDELSTE